MFKRRTCSKLAQSLKNNGRLPDKMVSFDVPGSGDDASDPDKITAILGNVTSLKNDILNVRDEIEDVRHSLDLLSQEMQFCHKKLFKYEQENQQLKEESENVKKMIVELRAKVFVLEHNQKKRNGMENGESGSTDVIFRNRRLPDRPLSTGHFLRCSSQSQEESPHRLKITVSGPRDMRSCNSDTCLKNMCLNQK